MTLQTRRLIARGRSHVALLVLAILLSTGCQDDGAADESSRLVAEPGEAPAEPAHDERLGRWRAARPAIDELTDAQREEITQLESIGYAAGSISARDRSGVTVHDVTAAYAGLNLVVSGHAPEAVLMDMDGQPLHRWFHDYAEAFPGESIEPDDARPHMWRRAHILSDGGLLAIYEGLGLVRLDRESRLVWAVHNQAHHDLDVADDGTVFVLTREARMLPRLNSRRPILEDFVEQLDPDSGAVLASLSLLECFEASTFVELMASASKRGRDIFHTNTVEILDGRHAEHSPIYARGHWLLSMRNIGVLAIVDPERREVVWARKGSWRRQHQPVLLDTGTMLVFDNGPEDARHSAVLEIDPLGHETVWSYRDPRPDAFHTFSCGSNQRLPNGNTLITESDYGRAFEVEGDGDIVWEYLTPFRVGDEQGLVATLFEVVRLERDSVAGWLR